MGADLVIGDQSGDVVPIAKQTVVAPALPGGAVVRNWIVQARYSDASGTLSVKYVDNGPCPADAGNVAILTSTLLSTTNLNPTDTDAAIFTPDFL